MICLTFSTHHAGTHSSQLSRRKGLHGCNDSCSNPCSLLANQPFSKAVEPSSFPSPPHLTQNRSWHLERGGIGTWGGQGLRERTQSAGSGSPGVDTKYRVRVSGSGHKVQCCSELQLLEEGERIFVVEMGSAAFYHLDIFCTEVYQVYSGIRNYKLSLLNISLGCVWEYTMDSMIYLRGTLE